MSVRRVLSEKKTNFAVEAQGVLHDVKADLGISTLTNVRIINRYDISGITDEEYEQAKTVVFSEPPVDDVYDETVDLSDSCYVLIIEALPGQYDQRADSAAQCVQFLTQKDRPIVKTAKVVAFYGSVTEEQKSKIAAYLINPVEARQASSDKPETLEDKYDIPTEVPTVDNFVDMDEKTLYELRANMGLAMSDADIIPMYIGKRKNRWHRQRVVVGEKIHVKDYIKGPMPTMVEVNTITEVLRNKEEELQQVFINKVKQNKRK